ncbi:MAG: hypothetical protein ACXIVQ_07345 [Acidimicrobiales bacterium]
MTEAFLDSLADRPDLGALDAWLEAADEAQLRRAVAWQRADKTRLDYRSDEPWATNRARRWTSTLLVVSTAAPAAAVKGLDWNDLWYVGDDERELLRRAVLRRPRDWAEAFVAASARVKLVRRRETMTATFLFEMLDVLVRHHDLPVPDGDSFLNGWARVGSPPHDPYLPHLIGPLLSSSHLRHRPDLWSTIEASLASGEITREAAIEGALDGLTTARPATAQRVLADVLDKLALGPEEITGRLPLFESALATADSTIAAVLLPHAVSLVRDPIDLDDLAAVVAGRTEKKLRSQFLTLLRDADLRVRLGDDAVLRALDHLAEGADADLRERIDRVRRTLTAADDPTTADDTSVEDRASDDEAALAFPGMWTPLVRERRPSAALLQIPTQLTGADIRRLLGEMWSPEHAAERGRINRTGHAVLLECLVRATGDDPARLRAALPAHDDELWERGSQPVPGAIICWLRGDLDDGPIYDRRIPGRFSNGWVPLWMPRHRVINAAAREALSRAHRVSTVLSTPAFEDGTTDVRTVLRMIESGLVPSYTPFDMAQTLLRLRPAAPDDLDRLDGLGDLRFPADPTCWAEHASNQGRPDAASPDGVDLIRRWVAEGGLRPLDATWRLTPGAGPYGGEAWATEPPLPAEVLHELLIDAAFLGDLASGVAAVTLVPWWTDLAALSLGHASGALIDGPGPLGMPSHAAVIAPLSGPPELQREAVRELLELVRRDALSEPHLRQAVEALNLAGKLPLRRVAQGLEQAFVGGGLADLWGVALGVTRDASIRRPRPSGLPDLLRLLADCMPAVPERDLPVELTDLAASRGTTKSHAEARALVAARDAS